jgi:hypothetical protein
MRDERQGKDRRLRRAVGTEPPTADELKAILDLAAEAAHASQRIAAPVATWLSAKAGRSLEVARRARGAAARPARGDRQAARGRLQ